MSTLSGYRDTRPVPPPRIRITEPMSWLAFIGHSLFSATLDVLFTLALLVLLFVLYRVFVYRRLSRRASSIDVARQSANRQKRTE